LVVVSDNTQEYVAMSSVTEPSVPRMSVPDGMGDYVHWECGVDAVVHEAHFADLFWDGVDRVGKHAEARDNEGATLECARDGDAAEGEGVGAVRA
jgi:hypothetical protein